MTSLVQALKDYIQGDVFEDFTTRKEYATDQSILEMTPALVVCPKTTSELSILVEIAHNYQVPIGARGGGSGVTGSALSPGIVIDYRKYLNRILSVDGQEAWVEPGVFLSELNQKIASQDLIFGPDPGSRDYATMGGVVGNNASGAHALKYGMTRDHVREIQCTLSSAQSVSTNQMSALYPDVIKTMQSQKNTIMQTQPKTSKHSCGLYLESLLEDPCNFAKLLTGSEGNLALFEKIKVQLVPKPQSKTFSIFTFANRIEASCAVSDLLLSSPSCIELVDQTITKALYTKDASFCDQLGIGKNTVSLWVEHFEPFSSADEAVFQTDNLAHIEQIWAFRSLASKLLHGQAKNKKPLRCIEDACVPIENLTPYLESIEQLLEEKNIQAAIFGHIGNGHLHINPAIDVTQPNLKKRVLDLMDAFYQQVFLWGGVISGEHGVGYLRQRYLADQWKSRLPLMEQVKKTMDPEGLLGRKSYQEVGVEMPLKKY